MLRKPAILMKKKLKNIKNGILWILFLQKEIIFKNLFVTSLFADVIKNF